MKLKPVVRYWCLVWVKALALLAATMFVLGRLPAQDPIPPPIMILPFPPIIQLPVGPYPVPSAITGDNPFPQLQVLPVNSQTSQLWLELFVQAGDTYRLDVSSNLSAWAPLLTNTALTNVMAFTVTNIAASDSLFIRAVDLTPPQKD